MDYSPISKLAADVIASYVSNNSVPSSELPALIASVHSSLAKLGNATLVVEEVKPAISAKKSLTKDSITCLVCGGVFKSMKRHLNSYHHLSPDQYREKFSLPATYPMVAPTYASERSMLAKTSGLGRIVKPAASVEPELRQRRSAKNK